jgi:peptidoglycan L-alanyl-D-glutamate endopeptidase CwlK
MNQNNNFVLSERSKNNLKGVDERLVKIVEQAIKETTLDFAVTEGLRSPQRQQQLVSEGKSQTLKSKHLTGHAVDLAAIVDGKISWDKPYYFQLAEVMKKVAADQNVKIRWGGDFKSFFDGPHFELM